MRLDRRRILQLGLFGAGAMSLPGTAAALATAAGFTHDVASGEPSQTSVLLWTRYVAASETKLVAEVAESDRFDRLIGGAEGIAAPDRDHTLRLTVSGLLPDRWYYYRFRAPNGDTSPVGRTRTLPDGPVARFSLGVFSCANLPFGWFNAYAHAAGRNDIDLMVHLGDYFYEYERGKYPRLEEALAGRLIEPANEALHLADYRLRYAAYRADPDLRRLHQNFPMIAMWDDHESANDSWQGGAENHQPESEGTWDARKTAAMRAYREWMPVSDNAFEEYRIGDLATIFRPETRLTGRAQQLSVARALAGQIDAKAALTAFRDGPWMAPERTILGLNQERTLADGFRRSVRSGARWQVLAQQIVMGSLALSPQAADWTIGTQNEQTRRRVEIGLLASSLGLPMNLDMWDGYPAARDRLLQSAQVADANLVVLSGDSHNAWAFDLAQSGAPAGVEFAGQSVTSPGYESYAPGVSTEALAAGTIERNPALKWANLERRGYMAVELTPAAATAEYVLLDTVRTRSTAIAGTHRMTVRHGTNRLA